MTRVLLADDRPLIALGVEHLFQGTDYRLVGLARTGTEAMALRDELAPDIMVLDCDMPHGSGLQVLARLRRDSTDQKVVLLTPGISSDHAMTLRNLQPDGVVDKRCSPDTLLECLDHVREGECWVDPGLSPFLDGLADECPPLTNVLTSRERDVLQLVGDGLRNREIAAKLGVTEGTIKVYIHGIFDKAGVHSRTELAMRASSLMGPDPDWDIAARS